MNKKFVRIDYTLREDVDLANYIVKVADFAAAMGARHPEHRYSVFQDAKDPRRFTHVGELVQADVAELTKQPFFSQFTAFQRPLCAAGPDVTNLDRAAAARD